jgi:hypothetical protein
LCRWTEAERRRELERDGYPLRLARNLTPDDVGRLVRDSIRRLEALGLLRPGSDPFRYRPGLLSRATHALDRFLGGTAPDLVGQLHDELTAERLTLWREHVRKLDHELPSQCADLFTYLIVEQLGARVTIPDPAVLDYIQKRSHGRLETPAVTTTEHHHQHAHSGAVPLNHRARFSGASVRGSLGTAEEPRACWQRRLR